MTAILIAVVVLIAAGFGIAKTMMRRLFSSPRAYF